MRLFLLRHAKSDWTDKTIGDHDRSLNGRGRDAVPHIGAYMATKHYVPDIVLCSTALRTRETLALLLPAFHPRPKIHYMRELYLATSPGLLEAARKTSADCRALLMIGHNPGIQEFAHALANPQDVAERERAEHLAQKYSTGALTVLDFSGSNWADIGPGLGRLVDFVRPKDLAAGEED